MDTVRLAWISSLGSSSSMEGEAFAFDFAFLGLFSAMHTLACFRKAASNAGLDASIKNPCASHLSYSFITRCITVEAAHSVSPRLHSA